MTLPVLVSSAADSWAAFYGDHRVVSVSVRFLHLVAIVVGGGTALSTDMRTMRALVTGRGLRDAAAADLSAAHRVVLPSLSLVVATGVLLALADRATFVASSAFWWKMGLFVLLLANGAALLAAEKAHAAGRPAGTAWLRLTSTLSLGLWVAILFAGVWLTVAA